MGIIYLVFSSHAQAITFASTSLNHDISKNNLQTHVKFLSSDALKGRLTGSTGEKLATQYIANIFHHLGLEPAGDNGTFFQEFNFTAGVSLGKNNTLSIRNQRGMIKNLKINRHGRNVLARLRINPDLAQMIVIGAHVDHLGHGELGGSRARDNETGMIHPGADDNASGVASILEVAASLSSLKAHGRLRGNKDILFAAWSGEELGILGSSYFIKNFIKTTKNKSPHPIIDAAINLDMIGHLRKKLVLQGTGSSPDWPSIIKRIKANQPISIITQSDPWLPTDSTAFYLHGVPVINFFSGAHDDYHTPRDKAKTLNYEGIKNISRLLVLLVMAVEDRQNAITYCEVPKTGKATEREFRIYLGTIPDYAGSDVSGVKLAGVTKNSPAELAGIKQDDVIIELAGKNIHDIYDYTFVLNTLHVDEPVRLVVLRGQMKVVLSIVARYRD